MDRPPLPGSDRPPLPGSDRPSLPGSDSQANEAEQQSLLADESMEEQPIEQEQEEEQKPAKKKAGKPGRKAAVRILPTLVMIGLVIALAVVYSGIRNSKSQNASRSTKNTKEVKLADISTQMPRGWKLAEQKGVQGSKERWALGSGKNSKWALFITKYKLKKKPTKDNIEKAQTQAEASLQKTGAVDIQRLDNSEIAGSTAWSYQYFQGKLQINTYLVIQEDDKILWQFSCQSPKGVKGDSIRQKCETALENIKW